MGTFEGLRRTKVKIIQTDNALGMVKKSTQGQRTQRTEVSKVRVERLPLCPHSADPRCAPLALAIPPPGDSSNSSSLQTTTTGPALGRAGQDDSGFKKYA